MVGQNNPGEDVTLGTLAFILQPRPEIPALKTWEVRGQRSEDTTSPFNMLVKKEILKANPKSGKTM